MALNVLTDNLEFLLNLQSLSFPCSILRQIRRNRDAEAELMKNVERWEVGTYYGEPIFFLDDENQYREPLYSEYFAHADPDIVRERTERHLWL